MQRFQVSPSMMSFTVLNSSPTNASREDPRGGPAREETKVECCTYDFCLGLAREEKKTTVTSQDDIGGSR